ncbi:hypothetical protein [Kribbella sp. CA-293567]|uniref:hypothetical protein n=1 Tax=Kribbella sp. CA-293567 TaxID=3002436 RepID=UPI0022DDD91E|nr:hypothetical protein [Kribbella sp. CA-293567]WBQ07849.1 hypothetical protein OX958_13860 [Kribbella sp. CA-293567]
MPSDLQRVAQGLVECLNEVPQMVAYLHRTAARCRDDAALAISASKGQATVAAQQLDAAAYACEQAAHYLSMAPPKAKAWAEGLVGESRSSDRPNAQSADRNRATGGSADVARRDLLGRVTRTSLPFKPQEHAEGKEAPLIVVARKAFEKLRKKQEKDDEQREAPEELELEIVVAETGEVEIVEQDEAPEERDFEIKVELDKAAAELLKSMEESGKQSWVAATVVIEADRVTGEFTYPDEPVPSAVPVIVDVQLPEPVVEPGDGPAAGEVGVPEIHVALADLPGFDPAFHPLTLGDDFMAGVFDPGDEFLPKELAIAERLAQEGWRIDARPADHGSTRKNPDGMVRTTGADEGLAVEFKTPESTSANALKSAMLRGGQQADIVIIDGRPTNVSVDAADRAYRRCLGQPGVVLPKIIHVILGDERLISYPRSVDVGQ